MISRIRPLAASAVLLLLPLAAAAAPGPAALRHEGFGQGARAVLSEKTVVVALEVTRDEARLLFHEVKDEPYRAPARLAAARPYAAGPVQLEVTLLGPEGQSYTVRKDVRGLCLEHDAATPEHIEGDMIWLHGEGVLVELPALAGWDRVQVGYHEGDALSPSLRVLAIEPLDASRAGAGTAASDVIWPENCPTPSSTRYLIYGNAAEVSQRISIVIVPDGYRCSEKAQMEADAQALVDYYRARTPFREHDPFINYVLVYAYSTESGTDECDCGVVKNTAMSTRFPDYAACNSSSNRCLFYPFTGQGFTNCDTTSIANITAAEARAPSPDDTIIMVNSTRDGGCGGQRAVYAASGPNALEIAFHEIAHNFTGLTDEYQGNPTCPATYRPADNVSTDGVNGEWPEWIADIGAPRQGCQTYDQCLYRPEANCVMRTLDIDYCRVCRQTWALETFFRPDVNPTAPVSGQSPASPVSVAVDVDQTFQVATRLGVGTTNSFTWRLQGPGFPTPTVVATGSPSHTRRFADAGTYTLTLEVVADTNFIKPARSTPLSNVDVATWTVNVQGPCDAPPSFAGVKSATDVDTCLASGIRITWDPATFGPSGGTYEVRRDGVIVASGLAASPYTDMPGDTVSHSYRVNAVSDDCGAADANNVTAAASDQRGTVPTFAGVKSAADVDSCLASGIRVSWDPATFPPGGGTYEVRRDGVVVASGLGASPHIDMPGNAGSHSYRVNAITTACGISDGNGVTAAASDQAGTSPSPLANVLRGVKTAGSAGAHFTWADVPGAVSYDLGGSDSRDFRAPVTVVGSVPSGATGVDDPGAGPAIRSYRVRQVAACGTSPY